MSKSSKRRLARAAILNAQPTDAASTAKSLLQAAAQTAAPQRGTGTPVEESPGRPGVPFSSSLPSLLNSELSTLNSSSDSAPSLPSSPETSDLKSSNYLTSPPFTKPSEFFKTHFEPHCPPETGSKSTLLPPLPPLPINPLDPVASQFDDYRAKLKPIFAQLSPDDPNVDRVLHNYTIALHIATIERLINTLPGMSEAAQVETNNQIVRMLSIIERTHSRKARELREKDAAARRIIREQQRKERQVQKEAEAIERNQRNKDREEQRRQRDKEKAARAEQRHQLAIRKLELKERTTTLREKANQEKLEHRSAAKSKEAPKPPKPVGPPNTWTCG